MSWHDEIEAGLPTPGGDEPATLRQDIVDELRDHLQCAMNREPLNDPEESEARSNVLARFGNAPEQLARRLWLDAMKEARMSKRLTLAFVITLTAVCLTACGMTWTQSQRLRDMALVAREETLRLLRDRDVENRKLLDQNRELLQKLTVATAAGTTSPKSLDWNPLKIKVVLNDDSGSPAEGFDVDVRGNAHTASEEVNFGEKTDAEGFADFGVVRPGTYHIEVMTPWGEKNRTSILVRPGSDRVVSVTAPAAAPDPVIVQPQVVWPELLRGKDVALVCGFRSSAATVVAARNWHNSTSRYLLLRPDGRIAEYQQVSDPRREKMRAGFDPHDDESNTGLVSFYGERTIHEDSFSWLEKSATASGLQFVALADDDRFPDAGESLPLLSPSPLIAMYSGSIFTGSSMSLRDQSSEQEFNVDSPEWLIEIPAWQARESSASLTTSDHPEATNRRTVLGAMIFLRADKDGDAQLSETESDDSMESHRIKFSKFPVTQDAFIDTYIESRSARPSGGSRSSRSRPPINR